MVAALGLSLVIANYGYSLVAVCGLLIVEASFVVAHRVEDRGAWWAAVHRVVKSQI